MLTTGAHIRFLTQGFWNILMPWHLAAPGRVPKAAVSRQQLLSG